MKDTYFVKIKEIINEGKNRSTYIFDIPEEMKWVEGSHISLALKEALVDGKFDKTLVRKFYIATTIDEGKIALSTRLDSSDSDYKKKLSNMCVGDECILYGCESHMPIRRENKKLVLISMGVGMATMRPIIKTYLGDTRGVDGIQNICVDRTGDYLYRSEISCDIENNLETIVAKSRSDIKDILGNRNIVDYHNSIFYIVGSKDFLKSIIKILKYNGVGQDSIMIDKSKAVLETYFNAEKYDVLKVKEYHKTSNKFMPLAFAGGGCSCGGNCTCK